MRPFLLATALALSAGSALADSIDINYVGGGLLVSGLNYTANGTSSSLTAGELRYNTQNPSGDPGSGVYAIPASLSTFCIEINQHTSSASYTYNLVSLSQAPGPGSNGPGGNTFSSVVIDRIHAVMRSAMDLGYIDSYLQPTGSATAGKMAATQLAVWEAIWEAEGTTLALASGDSELSGGSASVTSAAEAIFNGLDGLSGANAYISTGSRSSYGISGLMALINPDKQDQLVVVPLPTAAWAGFGLLGITFIARRRKHIAL